MKKIILLIVFILTLNTIFAQTSYLITEKSDGTKLYEDVGDITKLTFTTTFTCGDTLIYRGDIYPTVLIGSQCWMKENLNVGTKILGSSSQTDNGGSNIIEKYCYGDLETNCKTYGGLYQWNEAMNYSTDEGVQGICPTGWHIPTLAEYTTLKNSVSSEGNALKEVGQGVDAGVGTNTSGFSALFAGYRSNSSDFFNLGYTYFWSSTVYNSFLAYYMNLISNYNNVYLSNANKISGFSVRCLKD